jgi:predicted DNA-binding transcriptional regulator AlpA
MKVYSTGQVMKIVGISRTTLLQWLKNGKIPEPRKMTNVGMVARIWNDRDVERLKKHKQENYRKGRGRKPKPKR